MTRLVASCVFCIVSVVGLPRFVRDLAFTGDGKLLVSSEKDGPVRVWDVEKRKLARSLEGHEGLVRSLALSPDGKWLVTTGRDGKLYVRPSPRQLLHPPAGPLVLSSLYPPRALAVMSAPPSGGGLG